MVSDIKLGLIVRADNTGLGVISQEHFRYLNPDKTLIVRVGSYPESLDRFPGAILSQGRYVYMGRPTEKGAPSDEDLRLFMTDLDVVMTFEVPYNWNLYKIAREMGVKVINQINYEWLTFEDKPDLYQCPSLWHYQDVPDPKIFLPNPVSRESVPFRLRETAKTFLHIAGHKDTQYGRNGTQELLDALKLVRSDARFIVYSQSDFNPPRDPRLDYRQVEVEDYRDLYDEGDVCLYPRRYGGQSLLVNEALSAGMPVLMTDMEPQNGFLPKAWLMSTATREGIQIAQPFEMCTVPPGIIAAKIDEWAGRDIREDSKRADSIADMLSWTTLLPKYNEMFRSLL